MIETWGLLLIFAFGMVSTPGPANLLLMASGAQFGFRACIPFILGVTFGKQFVNLACFVFMTSLATILPMAEPVLRIAASAYLLFLAWKIAGLRMDRLHAEAFKIPGFAAGLIVHPLNPKAWAMMLAAYAAYGPSFEPESLRFFAIGGTFFLVQLIIHPLWCGFGSIIAHVLRGSRYGAMASLLLAALVALSAVMLLVRS